MKKLIFAIILIFISFSSLYGFELKNYLEDYLKNEFGFDEVYVDSVKTSVEISELPEKINVEKLSGRYLKFTAIKDNKTVEGKAEIKAYRKMPVAKMGLEKGKEVSEEDISESLVEYSKIPKGAVTERRQIIGKTLKTSISANTIFIESKLITIKKGQSVILKVSNPNFNIKMEGKALEDGRDGNIISVLNIQSNKVIKGVVADEKTVFVTF